MNATPKTDVPPGGMRDETDVPPGSVWDEPPRLTLAQIRPYAVAVLMHQGSLTKAALEATLVPHCNIDDLKVGGVDPFDGVEYDGTRLEKLVEQIIQEMAAEKTIAYSAATCCWVFAPQAVHRALRWAIGLNCALPPSLAQYVQQGDLEVDA